MQISQFRLKQHMIMVGARNIARAACTCAATINRFMHGRHHRRVLAHAEIII